MNIYNDYPILPMSELRHRYERNRRLQRILSAIPVYMLLPAALYYGFVGWVSYFRSEYVQFSEAHMGTFGIFNYVMFAVCGALMSLDIKYVRLTAGAVSVLYTAVLSVIIGEPPFTALLMTAYVTISSVFLAPIVRELDFMKTLPDFPFVETAAVRPNYNKIYQKIEMRDDTAQRREYTEEYSDELLSSLPKRHSDMQRVDMTAFDECDDGFLGDIAEPKVKRRSFRMENCDNGYSGDISIGDYEETAGFEECDGGFKGDITLKTNKE